MSRNIVINKAASNVLGFWGLCDMLARQFIVI